MMGGAAERHIEQFGVKQMRVLTVTNSAKRVQNMVENVRAITEGKGSNFFLFIDQETLAASNPLAAMWTPKTPTNSLCVPSSVRITLVHTTAIIAYGGRIFLPEDIKERFHATHTGIAGRVINARAFHGLMESGGIPLGDGL